MARYENFCFDSSIKEFEQSFGSFNSEDDVKINFFSKIAEPLLKIANPNLAKKFKSEANLLNGGRPDALFQNIAFEYKKPSYFKKQKGINEALYGRDDKDRGLYDYILSMSDLSKDDSVDELINKIKSQIGVGFDGKDFIFARFIPTSTVSNLKLGKTCYKDIFENDIHLPLEFKYDKFNLKSGVNRLSLLMRQTSKMSLSKNNLLKLINPENELIRKNVISLYHILIDDMKCSNPNNRIITLYSEWDRIFGIIYGNENEQTDFTNYSDSIKDKYGIVNEYIDVKKYLFALQSYYNILIKLLINAFLKDVINPQFDIYTLSDIRCVIDLFEGSEQDILVSNFFEIHFYEWFTYSQKFDINIINSTLKDIILQYELTSFVLNPESMQDVLQEIYMGLIPDELRHLMGEYFTPDWAVEFVLDKVGYNGNVNERICDPTCGSGAFLLQAIKRIHNKQNVDINKINEITQNIVGFDINPISAVSAKANYIISLLSPMYDDIASIKEKIHIPVYISDSVLTPVVYSEQHTDTLKIKTHLCEFELPKFVAQKTANQFLDELSKSIEVNESFKVFWSKILGLKIFSNESMKGTCERLFNELYGQHRASKNSFWAKIFKNSFAPIMLNDKFDFVVGNPPWISWKAMSNTYREGTLGVWKSYGIFEKSAYDKKTTHDDFGMAVTYVAIDYYLKNEGKLGFLLPASFLKSTKGGEGFRKLSITRNKQNIPFSIERVDDFSNIKLFTIKSMAVFFQKNKMMKYPMNNYFQWNYTSKKIKFDSHSKWHDISHYVNNKKLYARPISQNDRQSAWLTLENSNGLSSLLGSMLHTSNKQPHYKGRKGIEPAGAKGVFILKKPIINQDGTLNIENDFSRQRRKDFLAKGSKQGIIESDLVYPMLGGRNISRWTVKSCEYMLVPHTEEYKYGIPECELVKNQKRTYDWLLYYKTELFNSRVQNGKFFDPSTNPFYRLDNVGKYTYSAYKVLWKEQTSSMSAVVVSNAKSSIPNFDNNLIENKPIMVDSKVLFLAVDSCIEAHYVCGVINSPTIRMLIDGYAINTNRGVDVLKYIKVDAFDKTNRLHLRIAKISMILHKIHLNLELRQEDKVKINKFEGKLDETIKLLYLGKNQKVAK